MTKEFIHHIEWGTVLFTIVGGFFLLTARMDHMDEKMQKQADRTDRLYEMFIDLLKEGK